jgi:hypothetical protein
MKAEDGEYGDAPKTVERGPAATRLPLGVHPRLLAGSPVRALSAT